MKMIGIIPARKHISAFSKQLSEKTGLDSRVIFRDIIRAKRINHISLNEYEWTGYYKLSEEQKRSVSTLWTRAQFRKTFTDRRYISILMNKYIFSKVFSEFYGRKCVRLEDVSPAVLKELGGELGKVVIKPGCKGQGKGVRVFPVTTDGEIQAAMDYVRQVKNGIAEEYIIQHEALAALNPGAVSIVRFYSLSSPAGSYLFAPVLTVAISKAISNGCQDALTAMADIRTGLVISDAVDQNELVEYAAHPITGVPFKGLQLPFWEETIAMMRRAVPLASKISNIGWDVAITPTGPLIIEANTIPGFNTAQYRGYGWITGNFGYQPLFDEGMKGVPFTLDERFEKVVLRLD